MDLILALGTNYPRGFRRNHASIVVPDNSEQAPNITPPQQAATTGIAQTNSNTPPTQQTSQNTTLVIPEANANSNGPPQNSSPAPLVQAEIPTEILIVLPVVNASPQIDSPAASSNTNNNPAGSVSDPPPIQPGVGVSVNQNGSPGRGPPNSDGPPGQNPAGPPGLRPGNPNPQAEEVNPDQIPRNNIPEERMSMFTPRGHKNKFKRDLNKLPNHADCFNFGTPRSRAQTTTPSSSSTDSDDLQTSQRLRNRRRTPTTRRRSG